MKWSELFDESDVQLPSDFELKKIERGCVMRSLESALKVLAAKNEWLKRFDQTDLLRSTTGKWRLLDNTDPKKQALIRSEYLQEISNLLELITWIREQPSPMGEALRRHQILFLSGNVPIIHYFMNRGSQVLYAQPHHILHLGRLETGSLYSQSDDNRRVYHLNPPHARRDLVVFTPL